MRMTGTVAIVGVGMIGGSLGMALRERAGVGEVRGLDPDPAALEAAVAAGAITRAAGSVEEAADGAEAVFLAAPVRRLAELAGSVLAASGPDCVVSDVGSAKSGVVQALAPVQRERFIGGHPICGSEGSGVAHARADLFEGATYFLTPTAETRPALYERLHGLVSAIGARPSAIDAAAHDDLMAMVSHLPHVLAATLIHQAAETAPKGREALRSAGPSFADLTRVAGANPPLWADILLANSGSVVGAIRDQVGRLEGFADALASGDRTWLQSYIEGAGAGRERLRAAGAEAVSEPWRVVVSVPNRPGVISDITTALGHAHVNIEDLSLQSGAGEEAGVLALTVAGAATAEAAVRLIEAGGYTARVEAVD